MTVVVFIVKQPTISMKIYVVTESEIRFKYVVMYSSFMFSHINQLPPSLSDVPSGIYPEIVATK